MIGKRLIVETSSAAGKHRVEQPVTIQREYRLLLSTDKPLYQPGQTIHIRSLSLARAVGYPSPGWNEVGTTRWLQIWRQFAGRQAVRAMLREQGLDESSKYGVVLR